MRIVAILCAALTMLGCNQLFYHPSRQSPEAPRAAHTEVTFHAADGVQLHGWFFTPKTKRHRGTFVQFHGNAGNIEGHYRLLSWVVASGYSLFCFDYRGYGRSKGHPSRQGLHLDAVAAIEWAADHAPRASPAGDLVLYGQSLGGAVMISALDDIEERRRIRAVIAEGSFHSYEEIAASVLWRHPLLFPLTGLGYALIGEDRSPAANVAKISPIPFLIIHDRFDPVVPWQFGAALYELGRQPKTFWVTNRGGHARALLDLSVRRALIDWLSLLPQNRQEGPQHVARSLQITTD